jgi:branched-chain amino acid transport system substrate-binding protein
MTTLPSAPFASLLRRYRLAKGLTQAGLAERAQLSVQAIGALERGDRMAPRKETINLLIEALMLTEPERVEFEFAARQQRLARPLVTTLVAPTTELEVSTRPTEKGIMPPFGLPTGTQIIGRALSTVGGHGKLVTFIASVFVLVTSLLAGSRLLPHRGSLCLATDFPTSGRYAPTKSVELAVNLAVMQNQYLPNGYTLSVINYDDASHETRDYDAQIGAHNVSHMVQNPCIVGVVGPGNSAVAVAEMPIAANANLTMVSPSTTRSGLTLRPYAKLEGWDFDELHPTGKPPTFFRIAPSDVAQGLVAAEVAFDDLGARKVYVVNDRERFGEDLLSGFTQAFQSKGGRILGIESIPSVNRVSIAEAAARIVVANPDAIYYAGITEGGGGLLKAQLVKQGYTGPFVGGEGIATDPGFVEEAGASAANGAFAVAPIAHLSSASSDMAAQFIRSFQTRYPGQSIDPYAAEAYDSAMVLIAAIKRLIQAGQPVTREAIREHVQHTQYLGVIGPISFDTSGDIAHGIFSLYQVQNGEWTYVRPVRL